MKYDEKPIYRSVRLGSAGKGMKTYTRVHGRTEYNRSDFKDETRDIVDEQLEELNPAQEFDPKYLAPKLNN